jgi:hypothetical protein
MVLSSVLSDRLFYSFNILLFTYTVLLSLDTGVVLGYRNTSGLNVNKMFHWNWKSRFSFSDITEPCWHGSWNSGFGFSDITESCWHWQVMLFASLWNNVCLFLSIKSSNLRFDRVKQLYQNTSTQKLNKKNKINTQPICFYVRFCFTAAKFVGTGK